MRLNFWIVAGLAAASGGLWLVGCTKSEPKPKLDPHSPEALVQQILDLGRVLQEGVRVKDFAYVNDRAFYLQGLAKALFAGLDAERQRRLARLFNDVTRAAEELDHAAGRRHEGATVASMEKLEGLLKELEGQLGAKRKP